MGDLHISVVTPVYGCGSCLRQLHARLESVLAEITSDYEIIMVNDGSPDEAWETIEYLADNNVSVKGVNLSRNYGQHQAITAGLDYADGDWVVVMDCDLQDQPEEIARLYTKAQEGYDIVLARRNERQDPLIKRLTSWLFYKIFSYLAEIEYDGVSGNFRIMSHNVVKNYRGMHEQLRFFGGLVQWLGFPTASVEVEHAQRLEGKSSYTFSKLWKLATETIIAYSDKPLRIGIRFGFGMAALAFCYGIYILLRAWIYGSPIPGWNSIIVSLYFIGGIIISMLGILGIYLGKVFDETKKRPLYIVRQTTFDERNSTD